MSKQLALSAAFSVFATAASVLFATPDTRAPLAVTQTGAAVEAAAPALGQITLGQIAPALFNVAR